MTEGGRPLEEFIAHKTGREIVALASVPSFLLNDPDFDMGSDGGGRGWFSDTVVNGTAVPDSAVQSEAG